MRDLTELSLGKTYITALKKIGDVFYNIRKTCAGRYDIKLNNNYHITVNVMGPENFNIISQHKNLGSIAIYMEVSVDVCKVRFTRFCREKGCYISKDIDHSCREFLHLVILRLIKYYKIDIKKVKNDIR